MAPILSAKQFSRIRPGGDYQAYLRFVARARKVSVKVLVRVAPRMSQAEFRPVFEQAKASGAVAMARMANQIRKALERQGSPMAKFAKLFVRAGELSGYDPRFLAAFAAQESAWGRAVPGNAPYNFWGWSVYTGNQSSAVASPFQDPRSAFEYYGRELKKNYGGARSVHDPVWGPYAADPQHEAKIASILRNYFGGNPDDIRFQSALRGFR
jgi:flagellum-specific peptidoglycan hydrolase FlgJ